MIDTTSDDQLLADCRAYVRFENARQAFSMLVTAAVKLPRVDQNPVTRLRGHLDKVVPAVGFESTH